MNTFAFYGSMYAWNKIGSFSILQSCIFIKLHNLFEYQSENGILKNQTSLKKFLKIYYSINLKVFHSNVLFQSTEINQRPLFSDLVVKTCSLTHLVTSKHNVNKTL